MREKQKLLETLEMRARFELFNGRLRTEIAALKLRGTLQGKLPDDHIADN